MSLPRNYSRMILDQYFSFSENSLSGSILSFKVGQVTITCYYITFYAQLLTSINRFIAIFSPINYRRWFSDENSKFTVVIAAFFGLIHGALYFIPGCNFFYDGVYLSWNYDETDCYGIMALYIDLIVNGLIIGIAMLIDMCTLFLIIKYRLLSGKNKDVKFFIQAFSTSILYTLMIISDQILSYLNTNRWYMFATSTLAWELCHTIDRYAFIS